MREPNSAWVASAATNPSIMGEVSVRALAMLLKGDKVDSNVKIAPVLITQKLLNEENIKNMDELISKVPSFSESTALTPDWMPLPKK